MPRFSFTIRLIRFAGTRIACASPLMLISSSRMSSRRILPGWIGGNFLPCLVVVGDFDIGRSFRFPVKADSISIVDPGAELPRAVAAQSFKAVSDGRWRAATSRGFRPEQAIAGRAG